LWQYRKPITVTNSSGANLTDFQVKILDNKDLSADITAGKIQADLDDLRFTDINGNILPYWIEDNTAASIDVWIKVPTLHTTGTTVYMYYGNPSAASLADGNKVFEFFDDFNRVDSATVGGGWSETDGAGSAEIYSNQLKLTITNTTKNGVAAYKPYVPTIPVSMEYSVKNTVLYRSAQGFFIDMSSWSNVYLQEYASLAPYGASYINKNWRASSVRQEATISGATADTSNFYRGKVEILGTQNRYKWELPGGSSWTDSQSSVDNYSNVQNLGFVVWNDGVVGNTSTSYIDWFFLRKTASTDPTAGTPATEEKATSPVAYWSFDEGYGNTSYDSTTNSNNGTITNAVWKPESECVSGKCLYFDGSGDYVSIPDSKSLNPGSDMTMSAWIRWNGGASDHNIITKESAYEFRIASEVINYAINPWAWLGSSSCTSKTNEWHHVVITHDGDGQQKIYIDGNEKYTVASGGSITSNSNIVTIGGRGDGTSSPFHGFIDEPKIYNYARTAAQIKSDYNSGMAGMGKAKEGVGLAAGDKSDKWMTDGLVGWWKMDESSWGSVVDSSGNGKTGTANGGATVVAGKFGNGGNFDGVDDNISIGGTEVSGKMSVSAWIYQPSISSSNCAGVTDYNRCTVLTVGGRNIFEITDGSINIYGYSWNTPQWVTIGSAITAAAWHHVVYTYDQTTLKVYVDGNKVGSDYNVPGNMYSMGTIGIGKYIGVGRHFYGKIDDMRIYSRDLSPSEVNQLYNWAPGPVMHLSMDEKVSGNSKTLNDDSGNANNGTTNYGGNTTGMDCTVSGKYGSGCQFDGVDDYINAGTSSTFDLGLKDFTVDVWLKGTSNGWQGILAKANNEYLTLTTGWAVTIGNGTNTLYFSYGNGSNNNVAWSVLPLIDGRWHSMSIVGKRSAGTLELFIDGISQGSQSSPNLTTANISDSSNFIIGSRFGGGARSLNGSLDDVRLYNYARTPKQIVEDMNAGHPAGGSPVGSQIGYWKFDEGYGGTANNYGIGGTALNASLGTGSSAPAWNNSGKFGKALNFDGSNDYVSISDSSALRPASFTESMWVKNTSSYGSPPLMFSSKNYSSGSLGSWEFFYYGTSYNGVSKGFHSTIYNGSSPYAVSYAIDPVVGQWYYVAHSYDDLTKEHALYVNGLKVASTFHAGISIAYDTQPYTIGAEKESGPLSYFWPGLMDEIKIYNFVLTEDEIKLDMNQGKSLVGGSAGTTATGGASYSADRSYCPPGDTTATCAPVAEWKLDEGTGTTANDTGGNIMAGTWNGTLGSQWTIGKFGGAGNFNGNNNYISLPSREFANSSFSVSAWINMSNNSPPSSQVFFSACTAGATDQCIVIREYNTGLIRFGFWGDDLNTATGVLAFGVWQHVEVTYDLGSDTSKVYVNGKLVASNNSGPMTGTSPTVTIGYPPLGESYFKGQIDDVKLYSYARSAPQVAYDYNRGKPVGWWKMDEGEGTSVYDWSGNSNTGTMTTMDPPNDWVAGKYNKALDFDGSSDYITIGSSPVFSFGTGDFSISLWAKLNNKSGYQHFFAMPTQSTFALKSYENEKAIYFYSPSFTTYGTINAIYTDDVWNHIVLVRINQVAYIYLNGKLMGSKSGFSDNVTANTINIGNGYTGEYTYGQIDDVRVYNYGLTAEQVKQVMNDGAMRYGTGN